MATPATIRKRQSRAETVAALADTVVRTDTGGYAVPSATAPGVLYHVDASGEMLTCDCIAGQHGRACKHVLAVGEYIARTRPAPAPMLPAVARVRRPWEVGVNEEA